MKKVIFPLFSIFVVAFFLLPFKAGAKDISGFQVNVYIPAEQTISDNLVRAASTFDIRGTIEGDVIIGGNNIDISGTVMGDVLAAGSNIKISGEVKGDVRVAGGTIDITGKIGKNLNAFAATLDVDQKAEIGGRVTVWAGTVNFDGKVDGNLHGGAGSAVIGAEIAGDVEMRFDAEEDDDMVRLTLLPTARIEGNLDYYSQHEADIDDEAVVTGIIKKHIPTGFGKVTRQAINSFWWFSQIASLFGLFVVGLIIIWLLKNKTGEIAQNMLKKPGKSLLLGLAILILVPIVAVILMFTIIGIPLGIILLLLYGILLYSSTVFVGIVLGRAILRGIQKKKAEEVSLFWSMVIGLIIYSLAVDFILWSGLALGILSGFIKFFALIWALGAIFLKREELKPVKNVKTK